MCKYIRLADQLYEEFGKPQEATEMGKYIAISAEGRTLTGENPLELLQRASAVFGRGIFLFRVGQKTIMTLCKDWYPCDQLNLGRS